jgi:hypothetical protein
VLRPGGTEVVARSVTVLMKRDEKKISTMSDGADLQAPNAVGAEEMEHVIIGYVPFVWELTLG